MSNRRKKSRPVTASPRKRGAKRKVRINRAVPRGEGNENRTMTISKYQKAALKQCKA
jgi:hypothetical protein